MRTCKYMKRTGLILLLLTLAFNMVMPLAAHAQEEDRKVVRVGWYDSSFCHWDEFGRRCGIDYEYQTKISAYTGWTYDYVEDSWSNLLQMLMNGEIDLLSDVSYKPEREEFMSFPDLPMGTESYYIYIAADNREITADNLTTFNGKRIGVNEGSIQVGFLNDWAKKNSLQIEIVPLDSSESESLEMLTKGELDGFATIYTYNSEWKSVPVCRIGASEYFYAVNKNRPDLLAELNMALSGIQDDDPYFYQSLSEERFYDMNSNVFLTPAQEDWLLQHGTIRVGYRDNTLPFCQSDNETGELTGALKDYLAHAENNLRSSKIQFEEIPYPTTKAALDAMKAGEVDCVFPVYLNSYDADGMGIRLTSSAMKTEMNALMKTSGNRSLSRDSSITFAVVEGDMNIETLIMERYPNSSRKSFADMDACYKAVNSGEADCVLVSNYRMPVAESAIKKYNLFSIPTGEAMMFSFAVNKSDRELYFILNKTVVMTDNEEMDSSLASYMQIQQKTSFVQFVKDNWILVIAIVVALFLIIVFLLLQKLKAERKANEQQRMMEDALRRELQHKAQLQSAMEMAYTDPLTGVKSKHAFNDAEEQMNQRIAEGTVSEFSVVVFDMNDLKLINDSRGHEVGDDYIKTACRQICTCFKHSPVFRIGGDEFVAILEGEDYSNQVELLEKFEKQVLANVGQGKPVIAFGCSQFNPRQDKGLRTVFDRADAAMYREKVLLKQFSTADSKEETEKPEMDTAYEDVSVINVRKHILIADDMEANRGILGELLQGDYDILYACDGVETMEILRNRKDEIALLILDLFMPNMTGQEVMAQMQVDEDLMSIPVIVLTIDQDAELNCLRMGAMDFIPKPYPDIEIVKARIAKCIELSENRELIRYTQRDKLTGLYNIDYFVRYVERFDQYYKETAFDAVACNVNRFYSVNEQYGRRFGDLVLRSIGISLKKLARKTGGIGCRKEGDTFLLYCPHRDDYEELLKRFVSEVFVEKETENKVSLRFGVFANAQQEPDIEERFIRAEAAADSVRNDSDKIFGFYEYSMD